MTRKATCAAAQRQRDGVARAQVMLVGEGLADDGIVAAAQFGIDHAGRASGEKLDLAQIVIADRVG